MSVSSMQQPEHGLYYPFLLPYGLNVLHTCFVPPTSFSNNSYIPVSHVAQFASENKISGYCRRLRTRDSKNLIHFAAVVSSYPFIQV